MVKASQDIKEKLQMMNRKIHKEKSLFKLAFCWEHFLTALEIHGSVKMSKLGE